uniref:Transcription cofactor n=2 Tax=Solanum tuberosum TaxID=4113 RepID=M1BKT6_SOLTU
MKDKSRFSVSLRSLSQPMSLKDIARTWDICTHVIIFEYAQQSGGGTFSSKYGWVLGELFECSMIKHDLMSQVMRLS